MYVILTRQNLSAVDWPYTRLIMLLLYVKTLDVDNQVRDFLCQLHSLETGLEILKIIACRGNTLMEVYIVEDGTKTRLPVQAFDSQDLLTPIRQLQNEWEMILT